MAKAKDSPATTAIKVSLYETIDPLLGALYDEIQILSKKKPEATLNANKVKLINRLLEDMQEIMGDEPDSKYLDMLDDDSLPQYSDVVLILSQYSAAMKTFRKKFYYQDKLTYEMKWSVK